MICSSFFDGRGTRLISSKISHTALGSSLLISDIAFAFLRPCGMRRLPPSAAGWRACRMFLRSALIIIKMSYADFQSFLAVGRENVKIVKISVTCNPQNNGYGQDFCGLHEGGARLRCACPRTGAAAAA